MPYFRINPCRFEQTRLEQEKINFSLHCSVQHPLSRYNTQAFPNFSINRILGAVISQCKSTNWENTLHSATELFVGAD